MCRLRYKWHSFFVLAYGLTFPLEVNAQSVDLTDNYNLGYRSTTKSDPTRVGSFNAGGSIESAVGYDDNVFDLNSNKNEGPFLRAGLYGWLNSDWQKHALSLSVYGSKDHYVARPGASEYYANIFGYGRIDLPADTQFEFVAKYTYDEDERGADTFLGNPATTPGDQSLDLKTFLTKGFGKAAVTARAGVRYGRHEKINNNAGISLNRDDKDYRLYDLRLRGSYTINDKANVYVEGGYNRWDFDDKTDRNGTERGSHGFHIATGLVFNPTQSISGEIAVGYRKQSFRDSSFKNSAAATLDAWATWAMTDKANLTVVADTWFEEDTVFSEAGELSRSVSLQADYRMHERLRAFTVGYYLMEDKLGTPIKDHTVKGTLGVNYEIQPGVVATAQLEHKRFISGRSANQNYNINKIWTGLKLSK